MYQENQTPSNEIVGAVTGPMRETEMPRVLSKLFSVVEMCDLSYQKLFARLSPVLSGGGLKKDSADKAATPEFSSSLAQEINRAYFMLDNLQEGLAELNNRLEI